MGLNTMQHKSMSQMNKERKKKYNAVHAYGAMLKLFRKNYVDKTKNKIKKLPR